MFHGTLLYLLLQGPLHVEQGMSRLQEEPIEEEMEAVEFDPEEEEEDQEKDVFA